MIFASAFRRCQCQWPSEWQVIPSVKSMQIIRRTVCIRNDPLIFLPVPHACVKWPVNTICNHVRSTVRSVGGWWWLAGEWRKTHALVLQSTVRDQINYFIVSLYNGIQLFNCSFHILAIFTRHWLREGNDRSFDSVIAQMMD